MKAKAFDTSFTQMLSNCKAARVLRQARVEDGIKTSKLGNARKTLLSVSNQQKCHLIVQWRPHTCLRYLSDDVGVDKAMIANASAAMHDAVRDQNRHAL